MRYKILRDPESPNKPYFWIVDGYVDKLTAICNVMNLDEAKIVCGALNYAENNNLLITEEYYELLPEDCKMRKD